MKHYAGIDVSLDWSSVCVVDATGKVVREAKVPSEPAVLVCFLRELGLALMTQRFKKAIGLNELATSPSPTRSDVKKHFMHQASRFLS